MKGQAWLGEVRGAAQLEAIKSLKNVTPLDSRPKCTHTQEIHSSTVFERGKLENTQMSIKKGSVKSDVTPHNGIQRLLQRARWTTYIEKSPPSRLKMY